MIPAAPTAKPRRAPAPPTPRLRAGEGARIVRSPAGMAFSMQSSTWHHPWGTTVCWDGAQKEWVAVVRPGFVNGRAPVVQTTGRRMQATPSFLAPVTAWDGAADIKQAATLASETETVDADTPIFVPLYRNPLLPLVWGACGGEGVAVPAYFSRRANWIATQGRDASASAESFAASGRQLVSGDIVLHQPRAALTSQFTFPVDLVTGSSIVTQTLSMRDAAPNDQLKLVSMAEYRPPESYSGTDKLLGDYEEPTWDELLLARVYLLSPPNATGAIDGSWIPFVRHSVFWNLNWFQPLLRQLPSDSRIPNATASFSFLAGGAGQLVINSIWASINDMTQGALNVLTAHSLSGTFWAPTGGGSDSAFPEVATPTPVDHFGLSKDLRSKAARVAALNAGVLLDSLDPVFPYRAIPFDLSLL